MSLNTGIEYLRRRDAERFDAEADRYVENYTYTTQQYMEPNELIRLALRQAYIDGANRTKGQPSGAALFVDLGAA